MSGFPTGRYVIRPIDAPEKNLSTGPHLEFPKIFIEVPVKVNDNREVWEVTGSHDSFNLRATRRVDVRYLYQLVNRDNALYARLLDKGDDFRIESAGDSLWAIGIPNQDLLLTYDAGAHPQLTFRPADGSRAQRFTFSQP